MKHMILASILIMPYLSVHAFKKREKVMTSMIDSQTTTMIEEIFDVKSEQFPDEGVIKVNFPRNDISITVSGNTMSPFMGFTSWIAFQKNPKKDNKLMAMGDLVLLEDEVDATIGAAVTNTIKVTALHNHFFYEQPRIFFMHIEAEGSAQKIAFKLKQVIDARNKVRKKTVKTVDTNSITGSIIEQIMGVKGQAKDGTFKIVIGRNIHTGDGCMIGKNMGINTWAAFAGTDNNAMVDGDFAVLEDELQPVLKSLSNAGISIVAIHNHMTHEQPRMLFLHYIGYGSTKDLARGLKNALHKTSSL